MGGPSLSGVWAKYDRANQHATAFKREVGRVIGPDKTKDVPFDRETEKDDGLTVTYIFKIGPLPTFDDSKCSVIMGDVLVNFRGALDYLARIIVKRHGATLSRLKPGPRGAIGFPLAKNRDTFADAFARGLPGVDPNSEIGRMVARFQPYHRGDQAAALRALRNLSNRDKHRLLIVAFWWPHEIEYKVVARGYSLIEKESLIKTRRPLKTGAPVVRASPTATAIESPSACTISFVLTYSAARSEACSSPSGDGGRCPR